MGYDMRWVDEISMGQLREAAAHAWRSSKPGLGESDGELEHVRRAVALKAAVVHARLHCSRPPGAPVAITLYVSAQRRDSH